MRRSAGRFGGGVMRRNGLLITVALIVCLALPGLARADQFTFTNSGGVTIPDDGATTSTIAVSGLAGRITEDSAQLGAVPHDVAEDIDSAVVAPSGISVVLMSDACGLVPISRTMQFDDDAAISAPESPMCDSNPYKPTNHTSVGDTDGAIGTPLSQLSFFDGGDPNGTWTLLIGDDMAGFSGTIASWSLTLDIQRVICAGRPTTLLGTDGDDDLVGTSGPDVISGIGGNDEISGRKGKDVICGGDGKDVLRGGKGKDRLRGERGKDRLIGGKGRDRLKGGPGKDKTKQ
jgi:hypothetical protein